MAKDSPAGFRDRLGTRGGSIFMGDSAVGERQRERGGFEVRTSALMRTMSAVRLRQQGLIWRRAGDELVVLDLDRSEYLAANTTAAVVWEGLAAGASSEQLVALLCECFAVEPAVARGDVERLLGELADEGLVEPEGAAER
jgi:hypothetical protein